MTALTVWPMTAAELRVVRAALGLQGDAGSVDTVIRKCDRADNFVRVTETWQTSSPTPYKSNSAASDGDLTGFDLRILRAMLSSARSRHNG